MIFNIFTNFKMAVRFYIMTSRKVTGQILNIDNEKRFALKNLINVSIFLKKIFTKRQQFGYLF